MIRHEMREHVLVLAMEHGKVNALDLELLQALDGALRSAETSEARALVLTGSGSSFSAGVDLWRVLDGGAPYVSAFLPALDGCLQRLFTFPHPVVAAMNGHAIAGGCILACACDRRIMASGRGRAGVPELRVGVPFPPIAFEIVRAALSDRTAADLALSGATFLPEECLQRGIVDEVVDPAALLDRACAVAEDLGGIRPAAFAVAKRQLRRPALESSARSAVEFDREILQAWVDPEAARAIRDYLDRTLSKGR